MVGYVIVDGRCCSNVAGFVNQPASLTNWQRVMEICSTDAAEQLGYMNLPIA